MRLKLGPKVSQFCDGHNVEHNVGRTVTSQSLAKSRCQGRCGFDRTVREVLEGLENVYKQRRDSRESDFHQRNNSNNQTQAITTTTKSSFHRSI